MPWPMENTLRISVHGGHSGQFCAHAADRLEDMVKRYRDLGFRWVGITEHMPPPTNAQRYPDEVEMGLSAAFLQERFARYMATCRELQHRYRKEITLFVGCETEGWQGCLGYIRELVHRFKPDYIVGSIHHVDDICIDYTPELYQAAARAAGGTELLYCRYFDRQLEMLNALEPAVVGHFDLIRIFDNAYEKRLQTPRVQQRITRNLKRIKSLDAVLDYNTRALQKGAKEPYVSQTILDQARQMKIRVLPGDDAHGVADISRYTDHAVALLTRGKTFSRQWDPPHLYNWDLPRSIRHDNGHG